MKLLLRKDVAAGLMFVIIGLAFSYAASSYRMGVVNDMGPGYFPFWLGVLLSILGATVLLGGVWAADTKDGRQERWDLGALGLIVASIALFGILLVPLGLIGAVVVLVVVSSVASHEFAWTTTLLNAVILVALSLVIFVWGVGLQLPIWPAFVAD